MKKVTLLLFIIFMLLPSMAFASEVSTQVYLDNTKLKFSNSVLEENGTTLVPFRNLFEAMGASITFDPKTSTVKAVKGSNTVQLVIGQTVAFKNGQPIKLNVAPKSVKNVTYVPLRFVSQSFDYGLSIKGKTIYITSPKGTTPTTPTTDPTTTPTTGNKTVEEIGDLSNRVVYIEVSDSKDKVLASGSGVIVGASGEVITNYHVIDGAASAKIYTEDKKTYKTTTILAKDEKRDLALLKIDATGLPTVTIGDSSKLKLGESVVAIGSPLGFTNSLTAGLVSSPSRVVDGQNYIQISTPIDHGSSGGALFNMRGELVGITTAKIDSSANINLAIPSTDVTKFLNLPRTNVTMTEKAPATSTKPDGTQMTAKELMSYLNENYNVIPVDSGLKLHFVWVAKQNDDKTFTIGGVMQDYDEYLALMELQKKDDLYLPDLIYFISNELHDDLKLSDILCTFFIDADFNESPVGFPAEAIEKDGSGYNLFYNFLLGIVDYKEGYIYYSVDPYDDSDDSVQRIKIN
ncbi:copper amine oxidase domain protein [Paenibacillus curdlanolyticus YK9]|uniref:Copper amine oxidase domain protein n=1 Tax=Paenibacillus curdlanolyticus YK9 TaxID=717606 RepID=E0IDH7_9BACL|nr:trypsin-like peptidase domain-containing protein [Paenibacillus curdlanolyticus]EFM09632.1 copper amine oxidase domain protein [Paenibacillus curdlanolyticus YK9]